MNNEKYVKSLISKLSQESGSLSEAAWKTALACVGWAYVFGARGEECTPNNRQARYRDDHPTIKTACQVLSGKWGSCTGCKWYPNNERTLFFDCRGFTYWILKQYGITINGAGATSQWNNESNWKAKGTIDTVPDDIIVCLFVQSGKTMEHTGFGYKGETIECSAGVQHFTKRSKKWTHWAVANGIDGDIPDVKPTLRRGDKGEWVTYLQIQLVNRGYDIGQTGVDGDFGRATEKAVKAFQGDNGLVQDGIVGKKTWDAIEQDEPALYTVIIPNLRKTAAETLVGQYPGATMTEQ